MRSSLCAGMLFFRVPESIAIQIACIPYIEYRPDGEQPRPPLAGPDSLKQETPCRQDGQDHRQQRRRRERPFGSNQPDRDRNGALEYHCACDVAHGRAILFW